jgi:oligopeptide transport system ATP-binding protein
MNPVLLEVTDLRRTYPVRASGQGRQTLVAVDGISFSLAKGEILGLAGESGCGKSTLARLVCRLESPESGEVKFQGQHLAALNGPKLREMRAKFQPVFQDPYGSLNPRFTVAETLSEALRLRHPGAVPDLAALLVRVGLGPELSLRYPHQLSGGQRQRVGLARALAMEPELLVADEPLSSLDVSVQAQVLNLILGLRTSLGLSVLFISHDLRVVGHVSDRVLIMYLGRTLELAPTSELFSRPHHPYTRLLFQALPRLSPGRRRRRAAWGGEPGSPVAPPPGCRFYGRCPFREEACRAYENELLEAGPGRAVACRRWRDLPPAAAAGERADRPSSCGC